MLLTNSPDKIGIMPPEYLKTLPSLTRAFPHSMPRPRVLVSTIMISSGGVHTMTGFVVRTLLNLGFEPVIANYQPYSQTPELSVPSFRLLQRSVQTIKSAAYGECETHAIGAWLPELEFTHYFATRHWIQLIESCDAFVSVSGNVLAATAFYQAHRPFVAWVASDWNGDRKDRVRSFSPPRRLLDCIVNGPIIRRLERSLLNAGTVLSLSDYTAQTLTKIAGSTFQSEVMPMPVNSELFRPDPAVVVPRRIGFAGRIDDPRKNIGLLIEAMGMLKQIGQGVTALLIGGKPTDDMLTAVQKLGLSGKVEFVSHVPSAELPQLLQTLDVFVLPSHQEGLCIAALEAMACGVPVVSTRCGGPAEFVIPGQTGLLVDFDAADMAQAVQKIIGDSSLRQRLAIGARQIIQNRYTLARAESLLAAALHSTYPNLQTYRGTFA